MNSSRSPAVPRALIPILAALAVKDSNPPLALQAEGSLRFLNPDVQDTWGPVVEALRSANGTGPGAALQESLVGMGLSEGDVADVLLAFQRDGRDDPDLHRLLPAALADVCLTLPLAGAS